MPEGFNPQAIMRMYRQLLDQANEANEERYQDILGEIGDTRAQVGETYGEAGQLLEDLGGAELVDISRDRQRAEGISRADLRSRGLSSTTRGQTEFANIQDQAQRARQRVREGVSERRAGVVERRGGAEERIGQFLAQMMEARSDQGPDTGLFAQLMQQYGQGQGQREGLGERTSIFRGQNTPALSLRDSLRQGQPSGPTGGGGGGGTPTGQATFGLRGGTGRGISGGPGGVITHRNPAYAPGGGQGPSTGPGGGSSTFRTAGQAAAQRLSAGGRGGGPGIGSTLQGGTANLGGGGSFDDMFVGGQAFLGKSGLVGDYMGGGQVGNRRANELTDIAGAQSPFGQAEEEFGPDAAIDQGATLSGDGRQARADDWWETSAHAGLLAGMA